MIINKNTILEKILAILLMRFKISPKDSLKMTQEWLKSHKNSNYDILEAYLRNNLVKVENLQLIDLYDEHIMKLVNDLRGEDAIEIKDRRYNIHNYSQCFIGSDLVEWMQKKYILSKSEAIRLGQELIDLKIIHHVTDEHDFESTYLFYRFYLDE